MMTCINDAATNLALARAEVTRLKDEQAKCETALENIPEYQQLQAVKKDVAEANKQMEELDDILRIAAKSLYSETGTTRHPAFSIKVFHTMDYDEQLAIPWVLEHKLIATLKLDKKAFEKVAEVLTPDFVTFRAEPRVYVSSDLSSFTTPV
jgi:hypothetical protein